MRLLLVLPEFPPSFGGMQTHAVALAGHLAKRGHDLLVLTYQSVCQRDETAAQGFDQLQEYPVERILSRLGHFENLRKIQRFISEFEPDVIYSSTVFYGDVGKKQGIPVVCRSPGNDVLRPWIAWPYAQLASLFSQPWFETGIYRFVKQWGFPSWLERPFHRRRRAVVTEAARSASVILANSTFSTQHIYRIGVKEERVTLLPGGVDHLRFSSPHSTCEDEESIRLRTQLGLPDDALLLMTACRLVHKKGVDFLIRSLPRLITEFPNIHLVVVGHGPKRKKYENLARKCLVKDRVHITGEIEQEQIQNAFVDSDIFVLASRLVRHRRTGNCDAETMGRVLCEANAAGIPVIASRSGGIPSVIEHEYNGLLFESDNEDELLESLQRILGDSPLRNRLVANGKRRAEEEFDWSVLADIHEAHFRKLIEPAKIRKNEEKTAATHV